VAWFPWGWGGAAGPPLTVVVYKESSGGDGFGWGVGKSIVEKKPSSAGRATREDDA